MKYCLVEKIGNVKNVVPYKEGILYSTKDDSVFFEGIEILKDIDGSSIYKISDSLIQIWDKESGYYYFNGSIFRSEFSAHISDKTKRIIATTKPKRISRGIYKKDIYFLHEDLVKANELILENIQGSIVTYTDNILLLGNRFIINAYTLPSAQPLWQFDLGILGEYVPIRENIAVGYEVKKFLGAYKNELLVACSNGLILCLDIETGKESRRFHNCPPYQLGSIVFSTLETSDVFVFDEKSEILFALYAYYYIEIELGSGNISIFNLKENMKANHLDYFRRSTGYAWDDEFIYTIGEVANHRKPIAKGDRSILAFNRKTKQVDWQHVFENDSINTDIPQCSNNKLYQLTSNKVLHIFEKEP